MDADWWDRLEKQDQRLRKLETVAAAARVTLDAARNGGKPYQLDKLEAALNDLEDEK